MRQLDRRWAGYLIVLGCSYSVNLLAANAGGDDGPAGPPPPYTAAANSGFAGLPVQIGHVALGLGAHRAVAGALHPAPAPVIEFAAEQKPVPIGTTCSGVAATTTRPCSPGSAGSATELASELRPLVGTMEPPMQSRPLVSLGFDAKTGRLTGSLSEFVARSLDPARKIRRGGQRDSVEAEVLVQIASVFDESNRLQAETNRLQVERLKRRKAELKAQHAQQAADQQKNEKADRINRCTSYIGAGTAVMGTALAALSLYLQLQPGSISN